MTISERVKRDWASNPKRRELARQKMKELHNSAEFMEACYAARNTEEYSKKRRILAIRQHILDPTLGKRGLAAARKRIRRVGNDNELTLFVMLLSLGADDVQPQGIIRELGTKRP